MERFPLVHISGGSLPYPGESMLFGVAQFVTAGVYRVLTHIMVAQEAEC